MVAETGGLKERLFQGHSGQNPDEFPNWDWVFRHETTNHESGLGGLQEASGSQGAAAYVSWPLNLALSTAFA